MSGPLVERDMELAAIDDALAAAAAGSGTALVLEGPAGIGKTALLEATRARAAERPLRLLHARAGELEGAFAYGVVRQLFEPALLGAAEDERARLLAGPAAAAAPAVLGGGAEEAAPGATASSFAVVHGLYWLAANLAADAPLALIVDDAHWADAPSLRWLAYLGRRLDGLGATVIASLRSGEPGVDPAAREELRDLAGARLLSPAPLSEPAVATLLARDLDRDPSPELASACATATGGNPFFVRELAAVLVAEGVEDEAAAGELVRAAGPPAIARATLNRLGRISDDAVALARAVAVLDGDTDLRRAALLAGLGEEDALRALDALVATGFVAGAAPLAFAHPIVRAAIYDELRPGDRSLAHRRAAALLAAEDAPIDAVATHALRTEPIGSAETIATLRAAAAQALGVGAAENAVAYLERALAEGGDPEVRTAILLDQAIAKKQAGDPSALASLEAAARLAADPVTRARALIEQADVFLYSNRSAAAAAVLDRAVAEAGDVDPALALRARTVRALMSGYDPSLVADFERDLPALLSLAEAGAAGTGPLAHSLAALLLHRGGDAELVRRLARRDWDDAAALAIPGATQTLAQAMWALTVLEDFEAAAEQIERVGAIAAERGSAHHFLLARAQAAMVANRRGDLAAAAGDLRTVFERSVEMGVPVAMLITLNLCADTIVERPEVADIAAFTAGLQLGPLAEVTVGAMIGMVQARLAEAAGERGAAIETLRQIGRVATALSFEHPGCGLPWRSTLAAMLGEAEREEALALVAAELAAARAVGSATAIGVAMRVEGTLRAGAGTALLEEAATLLAASPARLEHARALIDLGAARRRAGERAAAREPLRAGLDLADRCGATRLGERARTELAATGARPRRARLDGLESLTPSELRVARLAAEGRTSRAIAQDLFVTTKTVDAHLGHVYAKLGIGSRRELGAALAAGEPAPVG
jgi:DNA-binding CsgD family transcriptional regulator